MDDKVLWVLDEKRCPDAWMRRSLPAEVVLAHFGTGKGWDDDFMGVATTGGEPLPLLLDNLTTWACASKRCVNRCEPCVAVAEFRTVRHPADRILCRASKSPAHTPHSTLGPHRSRRRRRAATKAKGATPASWVRCAW